MDQQLGRFMSIDPLAEKYYSISPYVYVVNNSMKYIDPDGRQVRAITSGRKFYKTYKAYRVASAVEGVGFWSAVGTALTANQMIDGDSRRKLEIN